MFYRKILILKSYLTNYKININEMFFHEPGVLIAFSSDLFEIKANNHVRLLHVFAAFGYRALSIIEYIPVPYCKTGKPVKRFLRSTYLSAMVLIAMIACAGNANAAGVDNAVLPDGITLYTAQGSNRNLREIPEAILTAKPRWEKAYFSALAFNRDLGTLGSYAFAQGNFLASLRQGYELLYVKHHGLSNNSELGAAYSLGTPDLWLGPFGVNFSAGLGLSQALGTPAYDDTPSGEPDKHYKTQLLVLLSTEWQLRGLPNLSLIARVHHRSGAYGLIAPRNVGSNFLAAGIRYKF
jgi:hypothetical protein